MLHNNSEFLKERMMDKNEQKNSYMVLCMFAGAGLGLAIGFAVGSTQGKIGISMCYGLVIGMGIGAAIGAMIDKGKQEDK